jgi:Flp pilus assembly protein TadD
MATDLNVTGIDQYQFGHWMEAVESFAYALQIDPDFVEARFHAALALQMLDRHEEATWPLRRAGELDTQHATIDHSPLFRNHLGLSSTLERHLSGTYRYQQ